MPGNAPEPIVVGTVVEEPDRPPVQSWCSVVPPAHLLPGQTFIANTPDGQHMQITVPPDHERGGPVEFAYTPARGGTTTPPVAAAAAPVAFRAPVAMGQVIGGPGLAHAPVQEHMMPLPHWAE